MFNDNERIEPELKEPNFIHTGLVKAILDVEIDSLRWMKDNASNHVHADGTYTCTQCNDRLEPMQIVVEGLKDKPTVTIFRCHGECNRDMHVYDLEASRANEKYTSAAVRRLAAKHLDAVVVSDHSADRKARQKELVLAALRYAAKGWHLFPVYEIGPNGHCTCPLGAKCENPGKHPRTRNGLLDATTDRATILAWWGGKWSNANIGIATGHISGFFGGDIDGKKGLDFWDSLIEQNGAIPETVIQLTPGGGLHILFKTRPGIPIPTNAGVFGDGVDLRGDGGYIMGEPSNHIAGRQYVFELSSHPDEIPIVEPPQWILDRIQSTSRQGSGSQNRSTSPGESTRSFAEVLAGVPEGQRDDEVYRYACSRLARGLSIAEIRKLVLEAAANCTPPFPEDEAERKIESACDTHRRKHPDWTDPGYQPTDVPGKPIPLEPSQAEKKTRELLESITKDPGIACTDGNLAVLESIRDDHTEQWIRLKVLFKKHGITRDVERALQKRKLRVVKSEEKIITTVASLLNNLNLPFQAGIEKLVMPGTFTLDLDGVGIWAEINGTYQRTEVAPSICFPDRIRRNKDTGEEQVRIRFWRNNRWNYIWTERSTAVNSRLIVKLSDNGLDVGSHNCGILAQFFFKFLATNADTIQVEVLTSETGWTDLQSDSPGFVAGAQYIAALGAKELKYKAGGAGNLQFALGLHAKGSREPWIDAIRQVIEHPRVMLAMNAAALPPCLEIFDCPNPGIDFSGPTSTGKTTLQRVIGSFWGYPDETRKTSVVLPWQATSFAIGEILATFRHLPTILDDSKKAPSPKVIHDVIYGLTGRGRLQGARDGGLRAQKDCRTVLISSGEGSIVSYVTDGGIRSRILTVRGFPIGGGGEKERRQVNIINGVVTSNYGHFGPEFVRWLIENHNRWREFKERYNKRRDHYAAHKSLEFRLADTAAAFYVAGELLHEAIKFPWAYYDPFDSLWGDILTEAEDAPIEVRALRAVYSWAVSNQDRFYGHHKLDRENNPVQPSQGWAGRWDSSSGWRHIAFVQPMLRRILTDMDFRDFDAIVNGWKNNGWLVLDSSSQNLTERIAGKTIRLVAIKREALESDHRSSTGYSSSDTSSKIGSPPENWPESLGTPEHWGCMICSHWAEIKVDVAANTIRQLHQGCAASTATGMDCPHFRWISTSDIAEIVEETERRKWLEEAV